MTTDTQTDWSIDAAATQFGINDWGAGYFRINPQGDVEIIDPESDTGNGVSLLAIVDGLRQRGQEMPLLLRVENILEHRIKLINTAFRDAIKLAGYQGVYQGVYPIKVNQQRHVIEEIARTGAAYNHGFEAGSKAELLIALASMQNHASPLVCNGFKDAEFVRLGLFARKLGINCFFVVENVNEIDTIITESRALNTKPLIGVRIKLNTRVDGHWQADSGDKSIFGLSTSELITVIDRLAAADMLDSLQLLHAHIGSQIPNIENVRAGVAEACRYYANLVGEGAPMGFMDLGGGLAVDYDGSASNCTNSMNYQLDEYCIDTIDAIMGVLDPLQIAHPTILTESGRATVAYSSILLFNVLDVGRADPESISKYPDDLSTDNEDLKNVLQSVDSRNLQESYHDAIHYRNNMRMKFRYGDASLRKLAEAETLYHRIIESILATIPSVERVPAELQELAESTTEVYYCNFSLFQSLPDTWAIDQVFPIMPIHRLSEAPRQKAVLADLTCDSDGKIEHFAHPAGDRKSLELHELKVGEDYYLGVFLVGAYQETLGDLHNLFGDTNVASVRINGDCSYEFEEEIQGDTIADVLSYVEYQPTLLLQNFRKIAERAVRAGTLSIEDRQLLLRGYSESLNGYTYFEKS